MSPRLVPTLSAPDEIVTPPAPKSPMTRGLAAVLIVPPVTVICPSESGLLPTTRPEVIALSSDSEPPDPTASEPYPESPTTSSPSIVAVLMVLPLLTSSVPEPLLVRPRSSATTESAVLPATSEPPSETDKTPFPLSPRTTSLPLSSSRPESETDPFVSMLTPTSSPTDSGTADLNRFCAVDDQRAIVHHRADGAAAFNGVARGDRAAAVPRSDLSDRHPSSVGRGATKFARRTPEETCRPLPW